MNEEKVLVANAADPEQIREAAEKEKIGRELELNDLCWILSDQRGRRFLWKLFEFAGMFKSSFSGEQPITMSNLEGQRNVGLKVMADLMEARPEAFIEMVNENRNLKGTKNARRTSR